MRTLGVIGGIAPPSTVDYYQRLTSGYRARSGDGSYPSILINSIDGQRFLEMVTAGPRETLIAYLLDEIDRLARAGADLALFASNTPHVVFDDVAGQSPIPLISIVEETANVAETRGFEKLGLLGAGITMERDFYPRVFARHGMSVVVPGAEDRRYVNHRYFAELVEGSFRAETRAEMISIVDRMIATHAIDAVILGGTELSLLFRDGSPPAVPILDTAAIHVDSAIERLLPD